MTLIMSMGQVNAEIWATEALKVDPGLYGRFVSGMMAMMPGMQHCAGGPGPDQFDKVATIERWRESGIAPDQIIATRVSGGNVDMTRPICSYPKAPTYKGSGSANDAANFTCK